MTSAPLTTLADDLAHELVGPTTRRHLRAGFDRRIAARIAERLERAPAAIDEELRLVLAIERALADDASCVEAHRAWSGFVELLVTRWGRARHRAGRAATAHRHRALDAIDPHLRVAPVTAKPTDVPAGPLARFTLQPQTTRAKKRAGGR
ncbi:hypothetical protein L6R52_19380 [Myxococcota bacterium]|nr:hypothetical protein [Myxococcota bacterium]